MTLNDFEQFISKVILERGHDYYKNDCVMDIEETEPGIWTAEVEGTELYFVEVNLENEEIIEWGCDCPFEGDICKHVVAVFYALVEELSKGGKNGNKKNTKRKKNDLEIIFKKAAKEELQEFIKSQFPKVHGLKNSFIAYFADKIEGSPRQKYKNIIVNMIRAYQGRNGFIDYRSAQKLEKSLADILYRAENMLDERNVVESLEICQVVIEEVSELVQYMDDSDGVINYVIEFASDIFFRIIEKTPPELKDKLFDYCMSEYPKNKYHDANAEDILLEMLSKLVSTQAQEDRFLSLIDRQIEKEKQKEFGEYSISNLLEKKINYLNGRDKRDEAWKLLVDNRQYPQFMETIINKEIKKKNFMGAIDLCNEAIEIARKKNHTGTILTWNEKLLEIYELKKDVNAIRQISEKLFTARRDLKYYKKLKSTYQPGEWVNECEIIIDNIKGKNAVGNYIDAQLIAEIFIEESYKERLLKLLRLNSKDMRFVSRFYDFLAEDYPDDVLSIFEEGVKISATLTGRTAYKETASYLKKMKKIKGGNDKVIALVAYFRQTYRNRKAMLEILNEIT